MSKQSDTKAEEKAEQGFFAKKSKEALEVPDPASPAASQGEQAAAPEKPITAKPVTGKPEDAKPVKSKPQPTGTGHPDHNPGRGVFVHPLAEPEREKQEREQKDQEALDKWEKEQKAKKEQTPPEKAK